MILSLECLKNYLKNGDLCVKLAELVAPIVDVRLCRQDNYWMRCLAAIITLHLIQLRSRNFTGDFTAEYAKTVILKKIIIPRRIVRYNRMIS